MTLMEMLCFAAKMTEFATSDSDLKRIRIPQKENVKQMILKERNSNTNPYLDFYSSFFDSGISRDIELLLYFAICKFQSLNINKTLTFLRWRRRLSVHTIAILAIVHTLIK